MIYVDKTRILIKLYKKQGLRFLFFFYPAYHLPYFIHIKKRKENNRIKNIFILKKGLKITGATLLTTEEAERLPKKTLSIGYDWWLRSPGYFGIFATDVSSDGSVNTLGSNVDFNDAVRPALELSELESSDFAIGDKFRFGNKEFEIVSDTRALCVGDIGDCAFRENWKADDANNYETSDIKSFVDNWYQNAVKQWISSRFS